MTPTFNLNRLPDIIKTPAALAAEAVFFFLQNAIIEANQQKSTAAFLNPDPRRPGLCSDVDF